MRMWMLFFILLFAFLSSLMAIASVRHKGFLLGIVVHGLCLSISILVMGGEYYALIAGMVFLVCDIALYFFLKFLPENNIQWVMPTRFELAYRSILIWCGGMFFSLGAWIIFNNVESINLVFNDVRIMREFEKMAWSNFIPLLMISSLMIIATVAGGFLLVRKEEK